MTQNLWNLLEPSLQKYSSQTAWICRNSTPKRTVSYKEIYHGALTLAQQLRKSGINADDTVGIIAPNGPEWTVAGLAIWKIGANIAPIHIGNSDHDIRNQIKAVEPKLLLISNATTDFSPCQQISLDSDQSAVDQERKINCESSAESVAVRIYTSGSTGTPKIVQLSHSNHATNVLAACKIKRFDCSDHFISLLPFSHAMGMTANLILPVYAGAVIVAPKVLAASEILSALSEEKISVVIAVPRLFRNIMIGMQKKFAESGIGLKIFLKLLKITPLSLRQYLNYPLRKKLGGRIKVWVSGGSHLDGEITKFYHNLGLPLRQGYGLTETSPLACVQEEFDTAVESVGKPIEKVQVKIHQPDENGNGEVWIKGPNVMIGYEDSEQNASVFDDGWFKTGDIGQVDDSGRITLTGRSKRLIVTEAGKNIYPEELETLLERDIMIKEAGVFELEMKPACVLAMDQPEPEKVAQQALKKFNQMVSAHNRIIRFAVVDELPRTPLGKIALQRLPTVFEQHEVKK